MKRRASRRRGRALAAAAAFAAIATSGAWAAAQPSVWDVARDPQLGRDYDTLVAVERILSRDELASFDPTMPQRLMRAAIAAVELAGRDRIGDPRLHFLVGDLLSDPLVGRDRDARDVLDRALAVAPDSPLAGRAWFNVAIASARLNDPERERMAYTRALEHIWERGFRANILTNRGESNMVGGRLDAALADYRKAVVLADRPDVQALAYYGLGIALERSGDLPAALDAMRVARSIRIVGIGSALDLPSVFFVPAYDVHYYKALSAMSAARDAKNTRSEAAALRSAASRWDEYLDAASADGHRWVPNAKRHKKSVLARLDRLAPELKRRGANPAR